MIKMIAFVILSVHWFNPLAWLAFILMNADMEVSCDENVIREFREEAKREYSLALVGLASGRKLLSGVPLAFAEGGVKERVKSVLQFKKRSYIAVMAAITLVATVSVSLLVSGPKATATFDGISYYNPLDSTVKNQAAIDMFYNGIKEGTPVALRSVAHGGDASEVITNYKYDGEAFHVSDSLSKSEEIYYYCINIEGEGWTLAHYMDPLWAKTNKTVRMPSPTEDMLFHKWVPLEDLPEDYGMKETPESDSVYLGYIDHDGSDSYYGVSYNQQIVDDFYQSASEGKPAFMRVVQPYYNTGIAIMDYIYDGQIYMIKRVTKSAINRDVEQVKAEKPSVASYNFLYFINGRGEYTSKWFLCNDRRAKQGSSRYQIQSIPKPSEGLVYHIY
jgi:hypothetical protein